MLVNADFARRAVVAPTEYRWVSSPFGGVERVMFDRLGGEQARATSLARYAPGSRFPTHPHPGGEEILVLSGVFSDGSGEFPQGWYLRNPPGSSHQPFSRVGALIFVKLRQMRADDDLRVRIDTRDRALWTRQGTRAVCPLFSGESEQVSLQRVDPGHAVLDRPAGGAELLVLAGGIVTENGSYGEGAWIRLPPGDCPDLFAAPSGVTFYLKTGHLSGINRKTQ